MPAPSDILQFFRGQIFETPSLPKQSFAGKTVAITGANTGLGFECAKHLITLQVSTLILAVRSPSKGETAKSQLEAYAASLSPPHTSTKPSSNAISRLTIHVWPLDMSSPTSIRAFAARLAAPDLPDSSPHAKNEGVDRVDALILNAGVSTNVFRRAEKFGLEETLAVNVIGTFLLATLALPVLAASARKTGEPGRLVVVGSNVHAFADHTQIQRGVEGGKRSGGEEGGLFREMSEEGKADMVGRYFLSKLMVMQGVRALAARVSSDEVIVTCPSPGWCKTGLFREDDGGFWGRNLLRLIGRTPDVGARNFVSAAVAGREAHGAYMSEGRVKAASVWVRSSEGNEVQGKLWQQMVDTLEKLAPGVTTALTRIQEAQKVSPKPGWE